MTAPITLASKINTTAQKLLGEIKAEYLDKIPPEDYKVLEQSCIKLMEVSTVIRSAELCQLP